MAAGEALTREEVVELEAHKELGVAPPDKFQDAVYDATRIQGQGYRWKTDAEKKAEKEAADTAAESAKLAAEAREKVLKSRADDVAKAQGENRVSVDSVVNNSEEVANNGENTSRGNRVR